MPYDDRAFTTGANEPVSPPVPETVRVAWAGLWLCGRSICHDARRLGNWLEGRVFPTLQKVGHHIARLDLRADGTVQLLGPPNPREQVHLEGCRALTALLASMGIQRLELSPRLEHNQLRDILMLLHIHRRRLRDRDAAVARGGWQAKLFGAAGVLFACATLRVVGDRLEISYTYCRTRFSRIVEWFERRHGRVADHRALFRVAPYYAVLPVLVAAATFVIYSLNGGWWLLLALTVLEGLVLGGAVYLFFMVVGSVEYDNEEKAYRLRRTYAELRRYADRTRRELNEAASIQQRLMPDLDHMPAADCLDWASSFRPESEVGGDYFDVADVGDGKVDVVFADVSGHGMGAAFVTAIVKGAFRTWVDDGIGLAGFVRLVNRDLVRFTPDGSFVAMIAAVIDTATGRVALVNSGHNPVPTYVPADARRPVRPLDHLGSMVLGVMEDIDIHPFELELAEGDAVVFATDGLPEAVSIRGEMFGNKRLLSSAQTHRGRELDDLVAAMVADVSEFAEGVEPTDDQTVLAFALKHRCGVWAGEREASVQPAARPRG